jgi:hypothetical protein
MANRFDSASETESDKVAASETPAGDLADETAPEESQEAYAT